MTRDVIRTNHTTAQGARPSRRVLLGGFAALGVGVLAACSDDKPKPASGSTSDLSSLTNLPGPQRMREQAKHLEPQTYVKTYRVDASGKNGAFRTLKECYAAVAADKQKTLGVAAQSPQSNPWDWRKIEIAPGTYRETASGTPPHVALVGTGSKPDDVHVVVGGSDDAIGTTGRSTYVRNMFFEQSSNDPDAHALREQGQSGDVGLGPVQRRTIVFENCRFLSGGNGPWGKTAADIMPGPGTFIVFKDCVFDAPGQQQQLNIVTNAQPVKAPSNFAFIGCTVAGNKTRAGNSDSTVSYPVGAPDFSEGRDETFLWVDGHWNLGDAVRVDALLAFPNVLDATNGAIKTKNPGTRYVIINPGTKAGSKATSPDGVKTPTDQVPSGFQLPMGCLSDQEKAFFGTKPPSSAERIEPLQPAKGTVKVAKGQVFWVAVDTRGKAVCTQSLDFGSQASGAFTAATTVDKDGKPNPDGNALVAGANKGGKVELEKHWYYPGQGKLWVAVAATEDVTVPAMEAKAGEAFSATGFTGGNLSDIKAFTAVAAGTLVPRPVVVSRRPEGMS